MDIRCKTLAGATMLLLMPALGFSANINEVNDRVENLEGSIELLEEANAELRTELDNKMHISGYVDVEYGRKKKEGSAASHGFRMHHLSLFFKKKISDKWRFFSEIEYEDGPKFDNEEGNTLDVITSVTGNDSNTDGNIDSISTESTSVSDFSAADGKIFVEAVNVDYLWKPQAIFRFGRFFTPAGLWSVDHYPPFVSMQERPRHIRRIFPQLVDGAMVYGTMGMGKHFINYDAFVSNGEGNNGHGDNDTGKAWGLKTSAVLAVPMFSYLEVGGTAYHDTDFGGSEKTKTSYGVHAKFKVSDFAFQTEAAYAKFEDDIAETRKGYYAQFTYEPNEWSGGYRYDYYNVGTSTVDRTVNAFFVNYRVNTNLVVKVEHHLKTQDTKDDEAKTIISIVSYLE